MDKEEYRLKIEKIEHSEKQLEWARKASIKFAIGTGIAAILTVIFFIESVKENNTRDLKPLLSYVATFVGLQIWNETDDIKFRHKIFIEEEKKQLEKAGMQLKKSKDILD